MMRPNGIGNYQSSAADLLNRGTFFKLLDVMANYSQTKDFAKQIKSGLDGIEGKIKELTALAADVERREGVLAERESALVARDAEQAGVQESLDRRSQEISQRFAAVADEERRLAAARDDIDALSRSQDERQQQIDRQRKDLEERAAGLDEERRAFEARFASVKHLLLAHDGAEG